MGLWIKKGNLQNDVKMGKRGQKGRKRKKKKKRRRIGGNTRTRV